MNLGAIRRIFQGSAATAWTSSQGGLIQNKHSGELEWELLGPLQKKVANFNDSNSEDEDEGELLNLSNRNI